MFHQLIAFLHNLSIDHAFVGGDEIDILPDILKAHIGQGGEIFRHLALIFLQLFQYVGQILSPSAYASGRNSPEVLHICDQLINVSRLTFELIQCIVHLIQYIAIIFQFSHELSDFLAQWFEPLRFICFRCCEEW